MKAPRRLKDDPDFLSETGLDLADEELAVGNYDLPGLRGRIVGGPAPVAPLPWWRVAVVSGVSAALVTFALVQLLPAERVAPAPVPAPEAIPLIGPAPVEVAPRSVEFESEAGIDAPVTDLRPTPPDARVVTVPPPAAPEVTTPDVVAPSETPATPNAETPPASTLVAELADYNAGVLAADRQNYDAAYASYTAYLSKWPEGRLRTEARLGQLGALVHAERAAEAERLADELLHTAGLGSHRADLRLTRAEALVMLDRCDEATALLEGMKRSSRVSAVRSTCRRMGRAP